jgi:hypothetical protein
MIPAERRLVAVVEAYEGYWPLSIDTLCRALAAQTVPLAVVGAKAFAERLDAITPEQRALVRRLVSRAVRQGLAAARAVRL